MSVPPPKISRLSYVPLRQAWPDEARDFTPWLSQNIDHLSDLLEVNLELIETEVAVEGFSADILAQDVDTGQRVLIENQLERSDHRHLGQIMTYLAGLNAKTIVWIAPTFTSAHLSAMKWLNEHTPDDLAFFAVSLNLAKIGDSDFAPIMEVQARPDTWERKISAKVNDAEAERTVRREAFWRHYDRRFPGAIRPNRSSNVWVNMTDDGAVVLSIYVAANKCGLFLRGAGGADVDIIDSFMGYHSARLAQTLGLPDESNLQTGHYFPSHISIPLSDRDRWDDIITWMEDKRQTYQRAIKAL